ncbi:stage II sporulation protein P [Clostridium sp.]|uniref:stage II sporulation protein P n=1 Tax=Clostridium sp. TaxID=1506 RepID=UPI001A386426|nr:stage II sporulation protein P [Clostridium sp.]MBK5236579.1 stage II sporulation protein P [Clostridium sp.]
MSYKCIEFKGKNNNVPSEKNSFFKYAIKKGSNARIFFSIFTLLIIFLLGLILPKNTKAYSAGNYQNYFYINVINNALSVFKASNTVQQDNNSETSMQFDALSFLGVDISNPISIIAQEVAYLDNNKIGTGVNINDSVDEVKSLKTFILNPFNLGDKQVNKSNAADAKVIANLYNPALKKTLNNAKPEILIYHSHTCEAYLTSDKDTLTNSSMDQTRNVCAVGDVIEEELEKNYGIAVIHDKTVHDKGVYDNAYKKSGVTLDKYLKQYGDFKLIIDLHRDSVAKNAVTTKLNGEDVAKYMFVVTTSNPRYAKQKKLIDSMIGISNKLYPDLIRSNQIHAYQRGMDFYSQDKSDNAVMFEVGSYTNTIQEAKNTGKYLARIIAEQLYGKK